MHAEDVKERLIEQHGVAPDQIAIKTSGRNDIEDIDLLDDGCRIEWIITKAALQEGWDCPYAYVLVSLDTTKSKLAITQIVGRVLRQPEARRTGQPALDESYVFCLKSRPAEVVAEVKKALEKEGYEGAFVSQRDGAEGGAGGERPVARLRDKFARHYLRLFEGKIFLPRFCVETADGGFEQLDYHRHLLARVDAFALDVSQAATWALADELQRARNVRYRVGLGDAVTTEGDEAAAFHEPDDGVLDWLAANLGIDCISLKESRSIVARATRTILAVQPALRGSLGLCKHLLREKLVGLVQEQLDRATQAAFGALFGAGRIKFYLQCVECRFQIPDSIALRPLQKRMVRDDNAQLQRSLFDWVPDDLNRYEREIALLLDRDERVLWWYRNLVGAHNFAIQGYRRERIYPDFVVQHGEKDAPTGHVVVIESKGKHLAGNDDTEYKRIVADYFTNAGRLVEWQELAGEFVDHVFRFQVVDEGAYPGEAWRDELHRLLDDAAHAGA